MLLLNIRLLLLVLILISIMLIILLLYAFFSKKKNSFTSLLIKNKYITREYRKKIIENEKRLSEAQRIAKIASMEKDYLKNTTIFSEYMWELFEVDKDNRNNQSAYFTNFEFIHPEDRNKYILEIDKIKTYKYTDYQINYRVITVKGNIKYVASRGIVEYNAEKTDIIKILITIQDISSLKAAERAVYLSEQKFTDAFNLSPIIMAITTLENEVFIDVNEQFLTIFNLKKNQIIGKSALDLNLYADLDKRYKMFKVIEEQGYVKNFEQKIKLLNSEEVKIFSFNGSIIEISGKKHFLAIVNDITDIKNAEKSLQEHKNNLQHIFDYSPISLIITGVIDGLIIKHNIFADNLLKINKTNVNIKEIFTRDDFFKFKEAIQSHEKLSDYEMQFIDFENNVKWGLFSVDTIDFYTETAYLISIVDITYRKKIEEDIQLSEMKFSKAFNNSPEIMTIVDVDNQKYVDVNKAFEEIIGVKKQDAINKSYDEIPIIESHNDQIMISKLIRQNNRVINYQTIYLKKNSEKAYCYYSAEQFTIKNKNYVLSIISDITNLITTDQALKLSEEKYRLIVENTTDGVYIYRDTKFVFFNKRLQTGLGYSYEEFNNMNIWELIHEDDRDYVIKIAKKRNKKNDIRSIYEARVVCKNGEIKICEFTTKEIIFNDLPAILGIVHDITELRNAEKELIDFNKYLESKVTEEFIKREQQEHALIQKSKLEFLGEMAAGMSHEINQPLTGISMGLENILNKIKTNHIEKEYIALKIENIFHYINRIQHIIEHVRTFSRDQQYAVFEKFSVNDTINNTLLLIEKPYSANKIVIKVDFNQSEYFIKGNKYRLEQVILNLLSNAKDALEEKAKILNKLFEKCIEISVWEHDNFIFITIKDNGIGIENNNIDNIFEPFYTSKDANKGTGLGLSIVYGIVKEFQGEITTESKINEYTLMKMAFPKFIRKTD